MGAQENGNIHLIRYDVYDIKTGEIMIPKTICIDMSPKKLEWYRSKLKKHYTKLLHRDIDIVFQYKS